MNQTKKILTPRFIQTLFVGALTVCFASCSVVQTALNTEKQAAVFEASETHFIEDFYSEPVAKATLEPEPIFYFERNTLRDAENEILIAEQRQMDSELYAESLTDGDIGGEDISIEKGELPQTEIETIVELKEKLNDFEVATTSEKFDPTKLSTSISIDILMDGTSCFHIPVPGKINSNFGWRHGRVHSGIDLDLETGDPVMAAIDGEVVTAEYHGGYGNLVVLKHQNGLETYYAHLSKIDVKPGDVLLSGQQLGLGGSTGRSTGPHLHFEVRYLGSAFNPALLVDFNSANLLTDVLLLDKNAFKVSSEASTSSKSKTSAKYYTVKKGDTLGKIAQRNGTTVSKICKLNKISSKKILKPGMKLRVK